MGFIYKITNTINGKSYIGKTEESIDKRWKEHLRDFKRERCKDRPLYRAMNKYGIENFILECLEETEFTSTREIFWIETFGTYLSGYNATIGGDGKCYVDADLILKLNVVGLNVVDIKRLTGYDRNTINSYLKKNQMVANVQIPKTSKKVECIELKQIFDSQHAAAQWLKPNLNNSEKSSVANKISLCCRNIRKSAYNYTWRYI